MLQAEWWATTGKMAAKVAHEIRNPLSSISLNAELLEDEIAGYKVHNIAEARTLLKSIISEVDRVTALTEEYLQFSRLPQVNPTQGSLEEVLFEVVEFLRRDLSQKKIVVEFQIGKKISAARFDRTQIYRVFLNIIRNAMEAMPKGGQLKIWTEGKNQKAVVHKKMVGGRGFVHRDEVDDFMTHRRVDALVGRRGFIDVIVGGDTQADEVARDG